MRAAFALQLHSGIAKSGRLAASFAKFTGRVSLYHYGANGMKNFLTSMLGAFVALLIFSSGLFVLAVALIAALATIGREKTVQVENGSYLVFDLSTNIIDRPSQQNILPEDPEHLTLQLRQVTKALNAAAKDERVAGLLLIGRFSSAGEQTGYATLREVREAVETFKASGKPVRAYLNYVTTRDLYVASVAEDLAIDPFGLVMVPGLSTQPMFFAGAFEKYGINVQVTRSGKYKSAIEPFVRRDMSSESREQTQALLDDIWRELVTGIASSRGIDPAEFERLVNAEGVLRPEFAVENKLANRVAYRDEIIDELKARTGRMGKRETFKQVLLPDYIKERVEPSLVEKSGKKEGRGVIGVVYAEGVIVDGEGERDEVGSARFARELRRMRHDPDVKAIVLRVNSPGGSASGSEEMQREVRLARAVKPVVVSMGPVAASGGYWISAYAERIFAEPSTITGSIGVFGLQVDVQQLASNLGVTFDRVKTAKFADAATITRPKTPEELEIVQRHVDWIYDQFIGKVAEGRNLEREKVDEIAQGRVWSGAQAQKLGLVDEIGGLEKALRYAAEKTRLGETYRVVEYPKKRTLAEVITEVLENVRPLASVGTRGVVGQTLARAEAELRSLRQFDSPIGVYARMPIAINIE